MQIGPYDVDLLSDGGYRLDGGSMFGVVPKILWEKTNPPDEQNRVELALNCLLLRGEDRVILVDNGMGDGWTPRELEIYGLTRPAGGILENLDRLGVAPQDVTDVVLTHLHFDHAGGTVIGDGTDEVRLTYPNATHWIQNTNLRWGDDPTERDRVSYKRSKWEPLLADGARLKKLDGNVEFLPKVRSLPVSGHTPGQQLVLVGEGEDALLYCGDLIPFVSQLRFAWIMAYDLNPLITLSEKKDLLARAATERWILVLEHEPVVKACRIVAVDGGFAVDDEVTL